LIKNPELSVFSWEVRAREARTLQASLFPNPELAFEIEEFGGSSERKGFESAESSLQLSQLIELGGKRSSRVKVASLETELSGWDYETKRLEVLTETAKAFIEVFAAQERVLLANESFELAKKISEVVSSRVEAGKVSPLEGTKAKVFFSTIEIQLQQVKRKLETAKKNLASTWGSASPTFAKVDGKFEIISKIPPFENLLKQLSQNPDIARGETELRLRNAKIELEKSKRIPDITISAGVQRFEETNNNSFLLGFSVPLPLFDRNQGGIQEAQFNYAKATEEQKVAELKIKVSLVQNYEELSSSYLEASALKNKIMPSAQFAFDAAQEGYQQGKFGYLEVLDAQRTLFEAKVQYLEALEEYHKAIVEIEGLIGEKLKPTNATKPVLKEVNNQK
jgi:cobalt-zinc-cadmium efflux system outer membrane protein